MFSDTLEKHADMLETGANLVLSVEATNEGDQVKFLARGVQTADSVVADAGALGLRVFLNDASAFESVKARLGAPVAGRSRTASPVHLALFHPDLPGEVEIRLPDRYDLNPALRGAIKNAQGVTAIEDF